MTKINPDGTDLVFSTLFGGNSVERPNSIAIDDMGNSYITGITLSNDFPVLHNSFINDTIGTNKIFIIKMNSDGSDLLCSAIIGGNVTEKPIGSTYPSSIFFDATQNVIIGGTTNWDSFPTTANSYSREYSGGESDMFVTKLNSDLSSLLFSTYLGGSGADYCEGIQEDDNGYYILGYNKFSSDFPTTPNAINNSPSGDYNIIISKVSNDGKSLLYSTYLGTAGSDKALSEPYLRNNSLFFIGSSTFSVPLISNGIFDIGNSQIFKIDTQDVTHVEKENDVIGFSLDQPYPNPFNPTVTLSYQLFRDAEVSLDIYNVHGQKISTVVDEFQERGLNNVQWNGSKYPSSVYFYRLRVGNEMKNGKLMLLK
ncbi:SBBP repeat-containing protein [Candidatus Latescibacterota bacterium]